jgi:hypothetical protein
MSGAAYDGIVCAYGAGVGITLGSGAMLMNSGGSSGVYLGGAAQAGPVLVMLEGSSVLYGRGASGAAGAGVYIGENSRLTMDGGIIQGNRTSGEGGGVYVDSGATFVMEGGLVKGNTASAGGGVLVSGSGDGGAFIMKGGSVTGNLLSASALNKHGEDVAVGAPSGTASPSGGNPPDYAGAAYSATVYPDAIVGSDKIGVQNSHYSQAVYIPESRIAPVMVGALKQQADTAVLDSIVAAARAQLPAAQNLTYAGNVLYAPDRDSGTVTFRLNYPDEIPAYDSAGLNVRNRYCYALVYVALDSGGNAMGQVHAVTPIRDYANIIAEIPAVAGAASYGIAKYYYDKTGSFDIDISMPSGGSFVEKNSGAGGTLHFDSVPSGSALVPSPSAYTLIATPDAGWHTESVTLTAGDGYTVEKDLGAGGEIEVYYTDLADGGNRIDALFAKDDGTIGLSMENASFTYDGRTHRVPVSGIANGDEVQYMYRVGDSGLIPSRGNPSFTEVNRVIADSVFGGVDGEEIIVYVIVTRGALSARESAELTILPRPITVKPVDASKEYDGAPLRADKAEIAGGTLVQGHSLDVSAAVFAGEQSGEGRSRSSVSGVSINGTNPANYSISYMDGLLEITGSFGTGLENSLTRDSGGGKKESGGDSPDESSGTGGGGSDSGSSGGGSDSETGDAGEPEEAADGGDADGGTEASISQEEPPKTESSSDGGNGSEGGGGWLIPWWWLLIVLAVAGACVWWAFAARRRGEYD